MKIKKLFLWVLLLTFIGVSMSCQTEKYKKGAVYHGFKLVEKRFVSEVNSDCYLFEHEKSGARLLKFVTDDNNKTFCIGFKTTPESDSGTPHIMEHSVLNGSKNFPVKSPFDVLSKGSLNTFLNAMTGSDVTVYPVASKNNKDYFNLMHVYLDAVLNPLIYEDPRIFKQEAWHYELEDKKAPVVYKGVVYNEMKGAFSSPTRELGYLIDKNLFPDNCYGFSSGGYPSAIPQLSYERFLDFHRKYYHPSNSYIFLYGDADLDKELAFINENYLVNYDRSEKIAKIGHQKPFTEMKKVTGYYSAAKGGSTKDNTYLSLNWVIGEGKDQTLGMSLDLLSDVLFNHESAPVRVALQKAGIGRDVSASYDNKKQNLLKIRVQNANPKDTDKFYEIVMNTLRETVEKGIDKDIIKGIINRNEFRLREGDDAQKGISYIFQAYGGWWYGNDPFLSLEWEKPLAEVKKALETNFLETIVKKQLLDNQHCLLLTMEPKPGLEGEKNKKSKAECKAYKAKLNKNDIEKLVTETKELVEYQKREDTPEALATIPLLSIADINPKAEDFPVTENQVSNTPVVHYNAFTNNIVYAKFLFDARTLPQELVPYASLLAEILGSMNTKNYTYGELDNQLNIHTGGFFTDLDTYLENRKDENLMPKFVISSKAMNVKLDKLFELTEEILNTTDYTDTERLKTVLSRHFSRVEAGIKGNGYGYARTRLRSYFTTRGMFDELTGGIEYYWFLSKLVKDYDSKKSEIVQNLQKTAGLLFKKDNLLTAATCSQKDIPLFNKELEKLTATLSAEKTDQQPWKFKLDNKNEGFLTASKVQYVMKGYDYKKLGYKWDGKMRVLNQILSRDWLYQQIRVIGGAYGGFSSFSSTGQVYFASYRDPNLKETIENFDGSPKFLNEFKPDQDAMTRFIIGTIARIDNPLTPSDKGNAALIRYLQKTGITEAQAERDAIISTTAEDIRKMEKLVSDILAQNAVCVYGNEEKIKAEKKAFKKVMKITD